MIYYLALYDRFGNPQRVAIARNTQDRNQYLDAGFVLIEEEEYNRLAAIVETARLSDLALLGSAASLLSALAQLGTQAQRPPPPELDRDRVEALVQQFARNARARTASYFAGDIDAAAWYDGMARQIVRNRIAARAAAVGGIDNLSQVDIDRARQAARQELRYLAQFRRELEAGNISERQAASRAAMYGGGAREQAEEALQDAIGLPRLPAQPGVRTVCRKNCKCAWDIRQLDGNGNWDCFWRRSPVDSCETCIARERTFNPLRIRGGVIQPFSTSGIYA